MPIRRPERLSGPLHGVVQPMVKYCPTCRADLEVITSRSQEERAHNDWCSVCGRIFEINYLDRRVDLDEAWLESAVP
jgi:transcription elongation factor Elf1